MTNSPRVVITLILVIVFANLGLLIVVSAFSPSERTISVFDALATAQQPHMPLRSTTTQSTNRFEALRKYYEVDMAVAAEQGRIDILIQAGKALEHREQLWATVNKAAWACAFVSVFCGIYAAAAVARK